MITMKKILLCTIIPAIAAVSFSAEPAMAAATGNVSDVAAQSTVVSVASSVASSITSAPSPEPGTSDAPATSDAPGSGESDAQDAQGDAEE
jgi:hypothetical protein